ncbi:MarR family winged helix-turn-helix transcriptional regulator [Streptomyces sp. H27-D2]|uniref:MarR family winged helix-turn-helix transcriptional regulator n=1 Tax=Streptomyces sp. H27-D2 TaxID=3046304 RepID=UPI002DBBA08A|nr:MarR family transcriptional regulator [Streptomyces sp. H27-D2]MEC4016340.1 MarR family transcriptional regulator [Streptomyces sp. H27-D2]
MDSQEALTLSSLILATAGGLVDRINTGVAARGFDDVRPAHGFAFTRIAGGGATAGELAEHLGVTKQAASQLVDELVRKEYVERRPHPDDARARLVVLTERGRACTRAAEDAAAEAIAPWRDALGEQRLRALREDLARIAPNGRLRPTW